MPSLPFFRITKTDRLCCFHYSGFPAAFRWPRSDRPHRRRPDPCRSHKSALRITIQIVLNDDDGCAVVQQCLKNTQQHLHIQRMQTDGRLVEHKHGIRPAFLPISPASLSRCASPPERLGVSSPSVRYPSPSCLQYLQPLTDNFHLLHRSRSRSRHPYPSVPAGKCLPPSLLVSFTS